MDRQFHSDEVDLHVVKERRHISDNKCKCFLVKSQICVTWVQTACFTRAVMQSRDPSTNVVLLEDAAAVLGVIMAASCMGLTSLTGKQKYRHSSLKNKTSDVSQSLYYILTVYPSVCSYISTCSKSWSYKVQIFIASLCDLLHLYYDLLFFCSYAK